MTCSDAWIDAGDDIEFAKFLDQRGGRGQLPPPVRPYWINHLKAWARPEALPIEYPDYNVVRVPVTKTQLQRFLVPALGADLSTDDPVGRGLHETGQQRFRALSDR
jgi:hypothetical protein